MRVAVRLVPGREPPPRGGVAVVVDVLRATTTLTVALANGAARCVPVLDPEEARALKQRDPEVLLCGERQGRTIPGFDLGNSPLEYTPDRVAGRTLVFASTNGSRALRYAEGADERVAGAFVNAGAVVERLSGAAHVALVCAGALGHPALEDLGCAGWIARRLAERGAELDGAAARLAAAIGPTTAAEARALVESSRDARLLRGLGATYARDVDFCATLNRLPRAFAL